MTRGLSSASVTTCQAVGQLSVRQCPNASVCQPRSASATTCQVHTSKNAECRFVQCVSRTVCGPARQSEGAPVHQCISRAASQCQCVGPSVRQPNSAPVTTGCLAVGCGLSNASVKPSQGHTGTHTGFRCISYHLSGIGRTRRRALKAWPCQHLSAPSQSHVKYTGAHTLS